MDDMKKEIAHRIKVNVQSMSFPEFDKPDKFSLDVADEILSIPSLKEALHHRYDIDYRMKYDTLVHNYMKLKESLTLDIFMKRDCKECDGKGNRGYRCACGHRFGMIEIEFAKFRVCPMCQERNLDQLTLEACTSCTSGKQTRKLTFDDLDIETLINRLSQIPSDACHLNLWQLPIHKILKQSLYDEGWSICKS